MSKKTKKQLITKMTRPMIIEFRKGSLPTPIAQFRKAAKPIMKEVKRHFKRDGWDLDFGHLKDDLFYEVYGHHLENYILDLMPKGVCLTAKENNIKTVLSKHVVRPPKKVRRGKK